MTAGAASTVACAEAGPPRHEPLGEPRDQGVPVHDGLGERAARHLLQPRAPQPAQHRRRDRASARCAGSRASEPSGPGRLATSVVGGASTVVTGRRRAPPSSRSSWRSAAASTRTAAPAMPGAARVRAGHLRRARTPRRPAPRTPARPCCGSAARAPCTAPSTPASSTRCTSSGVQLQDTAATPAASTNCTHPSIRPRRSTTCPGGLLHRRRELAAVHEHRMRPVAPSARPPSGRHRARRRPATTTTLPGRRNPRR